FGTLKLLDFPEGKKEKAVISPERNFDVGAGFGKEMETTLEGGVVGLIVDTRGRRPFEIAKTDEERIKKLSAWNKALNIYPDER
ncbi:methylaspartate mutase, partial [candidate division WOR-3 bacterium]|nr:methylaspartate mutase [candidate division WOR-3 bacterium]